MWILAEFYLPCPPSNRERQDHLRNTFTNVSYAINLISTNFAVFFPVAISKAAILGIALGALVILLMILVAACRPQNQMSFSGGSLDKPGTLS